MRGCTPSKSLSTESDFHLPVLCCFFIVQQQPLHSCPFRQIQTLFSSFQNQSAEQKQIAPRQWEKQVIAAMHFRWLDQQIKNAA
jgi:hypothetical protein